MATAAASTVRLSIVPPASTVTLPTVEVALPPVTESRVVRLTRAPVTSVSRMFSTTAVTSLVALTRVLPSMSPTKTMSMASSMFASTPTRSMVSPSWPRKSSLALMTVPVMSPSSSATLSCASIVRRPVMSIEPPVMPAPSTQASSASSVKPTTSSSAARTTSPFTSAVKPLISPLAITVASTDAVTPSPAIVRAPPTTFTPVMATPSASTTALVTSPPAVRSLLATSVASVPACTVASVMSSFALTRAVVPVVRLTDVMSASAASSPAAVMLAARSATTAKSSMSPVCAKIVTFPPVDSRLPPLKPSLAVAVMRLAAVTITLSMVPSFPRPPSASLATRSTLPAELIRMPSISA